MSFLLDPFLLIASGICEVYICKRFLLKYLDLKKALLWTSTVIILLFWLIAGALYFDILSISFLGAYGRGNHFMWNSGVELIGLEPFVDTTTPTYIDFFSPLNLLALCLFMLYPLWLYFGILVGLKLLNE